MDGLLKGLHHSSRRCDTWYTSSSAVKLHYTCVKTVDRMFIS